MLSGTSLNISGLLTSLSIHNTFLLLSMHRKFGNGLEDCVQYWNSVSPKGNKCEGVGNVLGTRGDLYDSLC